MTNYARRVRVSNWAQHEPTSKAIITSKYYTLLDPETAEFLSEDIQVIYKRADSISLNGGAICKFSIRDLKQAASGSYDTTTGIGFDHIRPEILSLDQLTEFLRMRRECKVTAKKYGDETSAENVFD